MIFWNGKLQELAASWTKCSGEINEEIIMSGYCFSREPVLVPEFETKNRRITTPIPCPGTREILESLDNHESRSMHGQLPLVWDKAENHSIWDKRGNKWIDFTSTIFVANIGHSNRRLVERVGACLQKPLLSCYAYANETRMEYLEKLIGFTDGLFQKAFLLSAGTEATEAAFKLMRMEGARRGKRRRGILCIEGNWHGRTLGAQMLSSNKSQKEWVGNLDPDIHHVPFPYPWLNINEKDYAGFFDREVNEYFTKNRIEPGKDICGVMLETFQGWGAVFYPNDYVRRISAWCKDNEILLTFDEMQSGFARTGRKFGFQHYDVVPDLICCGKGMGGGLPLSGVLGKAEIMDLPEVGNMSSTHSANPLVCAAGLAVLEEIESKNLVAESARKGEQMHKHLEKIKARHPKVVRFISGKGMIAAVILHDLIGKTSGGLFGSKVAERCMQKGLLVVHTGRESIKIGPPLTIPDEALDEGLNTLEEAIQEVYENS